MPLIQDIYGAYEPFTTGPLGQDPATQAYIAQFNQDVLPVIQNEAQLQGLGSGPTIADIAGRSLASALPQLYQQGATNRLTAASGLTGLGSQLVIPSWEQQMAQQQQAITGLASGGELVRGMTQDPYDAQREEMLRLQGLSEAGTFGAFGTQSPTIRTQSSGGK